MRRFLGGLVRGLSYLAAAGVLVLVLAVAATWYLLPRLDQYKPQVEQLVSGYLGKQISIDTLSADWHGLNVRLRAGGVRVAAGEVSESRMRFGELFLSFHPLGIFKEGRSFERLELAGPVIEAVRLPDGRFRVGDTILGAPRGTLKRLLQGRNLVVSGGTLIWRDALAGNRELRIEDVHVRVRSDGALRRFEFTADAPAELLRGFSGEGSYDPQSLQLGNWTGSLDVSVSGLDLARIPAVIQERLPWQSSGRVDSELRTEWTGGVLTSASAELAAYDFVIPYAKDKTPLSAARFSSSVSWQRSVKEWRFLFTEPEIVLDGGEPVSVSRFELERDDEIRTYTAEDADVGDLLGVVNELDIELPWQRLIDSLRPRGDFSRASLTLTGPYLEATGWRFEGDFRNVGWRAQRQYPGIQGLDGHLTVDENGGRLAMASGKLELDAADALRNPIGFDRVAGDVEWSRWGNDWVVDVSDAVLRNDDLALAEINLYTRIGDGGEPPFASARFRIEHAAIPALRDYLPVKRMSDKQVAWLDRALAGGEITGGRFYLNGPLEAFPYRDGDGELQINARIENGLLDFHEEWPNIEALDGVIDIDNARFEARVGGGIMMSSPIEQARVWSEDFFRRDRRLFIQGDLAARADDVIQFLRRGPLNKNPPPAYSTMNARGEGTLSLMIELPFTRLKEESRVQGSYEFKDAAVEVADGIEFTKLAGAVRFTESTVAGEGLTGELFGGPVEADVSTVEPGRPMTFAIAGSGESDLSGLTPVLGPVLVSRLDGRTRWSGRFVGGPGPNRLDVDSDLSGAAITFPEPLWKSGDDAGSLDVQVQLERDRRQITLELENRLSGELRYQREGQRMVLSRGVLNLGGDRGLPDEELVVSIQGDRFDMDQWVAELGKLTRLRERVEDRDPERDALFDHLRRLDIDVDDFRYLRRGLGELRVAATTPDGKTWQADITGPRLLGAAHMVFGEKPARYDFRMERLYWPRLQKAPRATTYKTPPEPSEFAHLSITAEDFRFGEMQLGRLDLRAAPAEHDWEIQRLSVEQPELTVEIEGQWSSDQFGAHRTGVDVSARASHLGKALGYLGQEGQVAKGSAELDADLSWSGEPGDFSLAELNGDLTFSAQDGRFLKLEPGSGRLLGLFNVETLARRLQLDFTDVFREGLAFDRINGEAGITAGRLQTDGIFIIGPAALIELGGSADLGAETYDLEVIVAPELGANLSLAGAIANPAAGAMLFLVQKLFRKQMADLIHYKYRVSGPWTDPEVEFVPPEAPDIDGHPGGKR